jgi:hypothetical protein
MGIKTMEIFGDLSTCKNKMHPVVHRRYFHENCTAVNQILTTFLATGPRSPSSTSKVTWSPWVRALNPGILMAV